MDNQSKVTFGWSSYHLPTPKNIIKISRAGKRLLALLATMTFFSGNEMWAALFAILGWFLDELSNWFGEEQSLAG